MSKTLFSLSCIMLLFWGCKSFQVVQNEPVSNNKQQVAISSVNVESQPVYFGRVPNDAAVKTGKLENGMEYYIMPNQKPEDRAELRLVVKAGSIDEDPNQLGLAHFIEHMAFNGTKNFKKNELVDYLESVGSRFGPDLNAYTSFDETVYMLQVRTDDEEQLTKGLLVLSDWASGLTFDPEEVEKERGVVISEWRSRLSPDQRMSNAYLPVLLKGSRYANRLPIGDPEIVQNADLETIKKFYYNWYRPELMAVVVVGDVDVNLMEEYVHEYFDDVPKAIAPRKKKKFDIPEHDETLVKVCSDPEAAFTRVQIVHKMKDQKIWSMKEYIDQMESSLIGQMLSTRLQEMTQKADAPFIFGNARQGDYIGPINAFTLFAVTPEGGALKGVQSLMEEVYRAQQHGFTDGELQRAKDQMIKDAETKLAEKDKTESRSHAGRLVSHFLQEDPYPSAEDYHWMVNKYVPLVRKEGLNERLNSWLTTENRVVIVTSPEKEGLELPREEQILSLLKSTKEKNYEAYVDEVVAGPLAVIPKKEVSVVSSEIMDKNGVEKVVLDNGVVVHLKPTDFNNDEILVEVRADGGHSIFPDENYLNARFATAIVNESGLGEFSNTDLKKKLAGKEVQLYSFAQDWVHGMRGSCSVSDLRELLDLIYLSFTNTRKDEEAFGAYMQRTMSIYQNLDSDPRYFFNNESQRLLYNDHLRRRLPSVEDLQKVDLNKSLDAYKKMFGHPAQFDFVFVGNMSKEARAMILQTLGNLPENGAAISPVDFGIDIGDSREKSWKKGADPKTYVQLLYTGDREATKEKDLALKGFRDVLNIKLREALREDKGGVYGVRVSMSLKDFPGQEYALSIGFNADPEQADDLIVEANRVLDELIENGPDEEDLQKIKEIQRQQLIKGFKENKFWARNMSSQLNKKKELKTFYLDQKLSDLAIWTKENLIEAGNWVSSQSKRISLVQLPE